MNYLNKIGFEGDLRWVYNEEGSGAKYYKSSVYFPDDLTDPQSQSGITIDPGLDLGNADAKIINEVLKFYLTEGLINPTQFNLLLKALGKRRFEAIEWLKNYRSYFKNKFLVPELTAVYVMDRYTAPSYWLLLIAQVKELLDIENSAIKKAVHTALLSHAYNRGVIRTIKLASVPVKENNWIKLAEDIENVPSTMDGLIERRKREALLIKSAIKIGQRFEIQIADTNPRPVTAISTYKKELVMNQLAYSVDKPDPLKYKV